ncbi:MAG TPA: DUF5591 domain-containing protein [candidate division Zixibacteria bacterium]|nr:DUF5591 domain-containing protein [candidate division Zixibacteria bacterium]
MDFNDEFLIGGDELFENERFINHFHFMLDEYIPRIEQPIAFFLSCSKHKPYYKSPYRRVFYSMLSKNLGIRDISQIYTVSEPAIIVPEELDGTKITKYDFPPEMLSSNGRRIFIERLADILPKLLKAHKYSFYILPKHHKLIFEEALDLIQRRNPLVKEQKNNIISRVKYAPPLTYNLPKTKQIIIDTLK